MNLIAKISEGRCFIGQHNRDEAWAEERARQGHWVAISQDAKREPVTAELIVKDYLPGVLKDGTIFFLYSASDVEKFFQAECVNKKLLDL